MFHQRRRDNWAEYRATREAAIHAGKSKEEANAIATLAHEKAKAERAAATLAAKQKRLGKCLHCQICGRDIFAETGLIAHHGYERPGGGWQTSSCHGARQLPYENDREVLFSHIGWLHLTWENLVQQLESIKAEGVPLHIHWSTWERVYGSSKEKKHSAEVTRATFDAVVAGQPEYLKQHRWSPETFDDIKNSKIKYVEYQRDNYLDEHRAQAQRWWNWKLTHAFTGGVWRKI